MSDLRVRFDRFELIPRQRKLLEDGVPVRLGGRGLDILCALAEARGSVVTNREIMDRVWPGLTVDEAALRVHISGLRRILRRNAEGGAFVVNVPGRGYHLAGEIELGAADANSSALANSGPLAPSNVTRIIGRDDLVESVCNHLPKRQFLTIVGPGGVGKTTLALEVVARLRADYDRAAFADFAAISDPALVGRTIALALGLNLEADDLAPAIAAMLKGERTLLVLDNCEHVVAAVAIFAERLCADTPGMDLLATSREPLQSRGEWVHRLPPLGFPPEGAAQNALEAMCYASIELFVERANAQDESFELTDGDAKYVGDICRRLDGVPLAIELAASWSRMFSPRALAERIDGHFMLRAQGRRGAPNRQRTLRATIDWSHDLLSQTEQSVFRRLAVFAGEFSPSAAQDVASTQGAPPEDVLDALDALTRKSLVAVARRGDRTAHHMLMAPRAYAAERLAAAGELDLAHRQHATWVLGALQRAEARFPSMMRAEWLRRYGPLVHEIRAATVWSVENQPDLDLALDLICAATPLWFRFSLTFEGRALAEAFQRRFAANGELSPQRMMRFKAAFGVLLVYTRAPNGDVVENWTTVLQLAQDQGDVEHQMLAHWALQLMAGFRCDIRARRRHSESFARLAETRNDLADHVAAERLLTAARFSFGELESARDSIRRMLSLLETPISSSGVIRYQFDPAASAQSVLSRIRWLQGFPDDALKAARASVELAKGAGHGLTLAFAWLDGLAHIAILNGDHELAHEALDQHLAMPESQGLRATEAVEAMRAIAFADAGDLGRATEMLVAIFANPEASRFVGRFPSLIGRLSELLGYGGHVDLGLSLLTNSRARFVQDDEDVMLPDLTRARAVLLSMRGVDDEPERLLRSALEHAETQGALAWRLRAAIDLAHIAAPARKSAALDKLREIVERLGPGSSLDQRRALRLLEHAATDSMIVR